MKGFSLMIIGMFVFSLFLFPFVIGEGSSTDGVDDNTTTNDTGRVAIVTDREVSLDRAINATLNRSERGDQVLRILRNCDGIEERRDRIACRLKVSDREEFEDEDTSRIPEVCRALGDREACRTLYRAANHCYEIDNLHEVEGNHRAQTTMLQRHQ